MPVMSKILGRTAEGLKIFRNMLTLKNRIFKYDNIV